jgi:hypothetical protein
VIRKSPPPPSLPRLSKYKVSINSSAHGVKLTPYTLLAGQKKIRRLFEWKTRGREDEGNGRREERNARGKEDEGNGRHAEWKTWEWKTWEWKKRGMGTNH